MTRVPKPTYYSNWGDLIGYPVAKSLLPLLLKIPNLTPNIISVAAFLLFTVGCILLFLPLPYHEIFAAFFIFFGYIGDHLDGQFARFKHMQSVIGDYLDKVLDVFKIFIINFSLGVATYIQTGELIYFGLGFIACFFFMFRYYIKLETVLSIASRDKNYLEKCAEERLKLEIKSDELYDKKPSGLGEFFSIFAYKNRTIFYLDEAELAIFAAFGALTNSLILVIWILAIGQILLTIFRLFERGNQLSNDSEDLFKPLRK